MSKHLILWCSDCNCPLYAVESPEGEVMLVGGGGRIHATGTDAQKAMQRRAARRFAERKKRR